MPEPGKPAPSLRSVAYVIWGALVFGVLMFAAVAAFVGPGLREGMGSQPPGVLPIVALAVAAGLLAASRILPRALRAGTPPLTRNIVAVALGEAGALLGVVAWMLTGSGTALAAIGIGLAAMLSCFPGDARWRSLGGMDRAGGAGPSLDRSGGPGFGGPGR